MRRILMRVSIVLLLPATLLYKKKKINKQNEKKKQTRTQPINSPSLEISICYFDQSIDPQRHAQNNHDSIRTINQLILNRKKTIITQHIKIQIITISENTQIIKNKIKKKYFWFFYFDCR